MAESVFDKPIDNAIQEINDKIGTVPSGQTVEGQIDALNSKMPHYYDAGGVQDANATYQIPDFANHSLFTIVCRRYGYANSATFPREAIVQDAVQHCVIQNTSSGASDGKTEISISTTGLIKVLSTGSPVFLHVIVQ